MKTNTKISQLEVLGIIRDVQVGLLDAQAVEDVGAAELASTVEYRGENADGISFFYHNEYGWIDETGQPSNPHAVPY